MGAGGIKKAPGLGTGNTYRNARPFEAGIEENRASQDTLHISCPLVSGCPSTAGLKFLSDNIGKIGTGNKRNVGADHTLLKHLIKNVAVVEETPLKSLDISRPCLSYYTINIP